MFSGEFVYVEKLGGFTPVFKTISKSQWFVDYYKSREKCIIKLCWQKAKKYLLSSSGRAPHLINKSDLPHVYFMQNVENKQIKIGVSIHPEIRRKQIITEVKNYIKILHIIPSAGYDQEQFLHEKFREFRIRGEWFKPDSVLLDYIERISKNIMYEM